MDDFFSATDLIRMQRALTAPGERARAPSQARALAMSAASTPARPFYPATVQFDPMLRRLNLSYGPDAANVLFHIVNERHQRGRPMLFTTNKPPLTAWGEVLHDHDLAEAIVDRVLENGGLLLLDGPSYRTRHLALSAQDAHDGLHQPAIISGNQPAEFPEPTIIGRRS